MPERPLDEVPREVVREEPDDRNRGEGQITTQRRAGPNRAIRRPPSHPELHEARPEPPAQGLSHIDESAIERSNRVMRQLAEVGIKVGGYSLGPKLDREMPVPEDAKQGPHVW